MKNAFLLSSLVLIAGYASLALVAPSGVISASIPGFSIALGGYAGVGVLAFAFRDYTRKTRLNARPSPCASARPADHPLSLPDSTLQAN